MSSSGSYSLTLLGKGGLKSFPELFSADIQGLMYEDWDRDPKDQGGGGVAVTPSGLPG